MMRRNNFLLRIIPLFVVFGFLFFTYADVVSANFKGFNENKYKYNYLTDALCSDGARIATEKNFKGNVTKQDNGAGIQIGCLVAHSDDFHKYKSTYEFIYNELVKSYYANLTEIERVKGYKPASQVTTQEAVKIITNYKPKYINSGPITESDLKNEARKLDEYFGDMFYIWANNGKTKKGETLAPNAIEDGWQLALQRYQNEVKNGPKQNPGKSITTSGANLENTKFQVFGAPGFFTSGFGAVVGNCEYFVNTDSDRNEIYNSKNISGYNPNELVGDLEKIKDSATSLQDTADGSGRSATRSSKAVTDIAGSVTDASVDPDMKNGQTLTGVNCADFGLFNTITKLFQPVNITNVKPVMEITNIMQNIALGLGAMIVAVYGIYIATGNVTTDPFRFLLRGFAVIFIVSFLPYFVQDLLNINNYIVYQIAYEGLSLGDAKGPAIAIILVQAIAFALAAAAAMFVSGVGITLLVIGLLILLYFIIVAAKIVFTLLFWWYSRLLTIFFLMAVGPLFVVAMLFPKTSEYGSKWMRFMLSEVFSQSLFVIAAYVISHLFKNLGVINEALNFGAFGNIILVYAAMIFLSKVPAFLQNIIGQNFGVLGWNDAVSFGQQAGSFIQKAGIAAMSGAVRGYRDREARNILDERDAIYAEQDAIKAAYESLDDLNLTPEERREQEELLEMRQQEVDERAEDLREKLAMKARQDRRQEILSAVASDAKQNKINLNSNSDELKRASVNRPVEANAMFAEQAEYEAHLIKLHNEEKLANKKLEEGQISEEEHQRIMDEIKHRRAWAYNKLEEEVSEYVGKFGNYSNPLYRDMERRRILSEVVDAAHANVEKAIAENEDQQQQGTDIGGGGTSGGDGRGGGNAFDWLDEEIIDKRNNMSHNGGDTPPRDEGGNETHRREEIDDEFPVQEQYAQNTSDDSDDGTPREEKINDERPVHKRYTQNTGDESDAPPREEIREEIRGNIDEEAPIQTQHTQTEQNENETRERNENRGGERTGYEVRTRRRSGATEEFAMPTEVYKSEDSFTSSSGLEDDGATPIRNEQSTTMHPHTEDAQLDNFIIDDSQSTVHTQESMSHNQETGHQVFGSERHANTGQTIEMRQDAQLDNFIIDDSQSTVHTQESMSHNQEIGHQVFGSERHTNTGQTIEMRQESVDGTISSETSQTPGREYPEVRANTQINEDSIDVSNDTQEPIIKETVFSGTSRQQQETIIAQAPSDTSTSEQIMDTSGNAQEPVIRDSTTGNIPKHEAIQINAEEPIVQETVKTDSGSEETIDILNQSQSPQQYNVKEIPLPNYGNNEELNVARQNFDKIITSTGSDIDSVKITEIRSTSDDMIPVYEITDGKNEVFTTDKYESYIEKTGDTISASNIKVDSKEEIAAGAEMIKRSVEKGVKRASFEVPLEIFEKENAAGELQKIIEPYNQANFEFVGTLVEKNKASIVMYHNENRKPKSYKELTESIINGEVFDSKEEANNYINKILNSMKKKN